MPFFCSTSCCSTSQNYPNPLSLPSQNNLTPPQPLASLPSPQPNPLTRSSRYHPPPATRRAAVHPRTSCTPQSLPLPTLMPSLLLNPLVAFTPPARSSR